MKKDLTITIPEFMEISVGQYQQYYKLIGSDPKARLVLEGNPLVQMKLINIFCRIEMDIIRHLIEARDLLSISMEIALQIDKLNNYKEVTFQPRFTHEGVDFGFIPNFEKMSAGEFGDMLTVFGDWDQMHTALAILYRPVTHTKKSAFLDIEQYHIQPYDGTSEWEEFMRGIPVVKAFAVNFLLVNSIKELAQCSLSYYQDLAKNRVKELTPKNLTQEEEELLTRLSKLSTINGDGMKAL